MDFITGEKVTGRYSDSKGRVVGKIKRNSAEYKRLAKKYKKDYDTDFEETAGFNPNKKFFLVQVRNKKEVYGEDELIKRQW